jgi:type II secretory pathway component GspD/PulD (secretin)
MSRIAGVLVVAAWVGLSARAEEKSDEKTKRIAYVVRYGSAKDMAKALGAHLKDVAEVEVLPEPSSDCLLIRTTPAAFDEVVKLLAMLDRRPKLVAIDLWVVDVPGRKPDEKAAEPVDPKDLSGTTEEVQSKVAELRKSGRVGEVKHLQLTAVEGLPSKTLAGSSKPFVSGMHVTPTGNVSRSIMYRNVGTNVLVTPRVAPDNQVSLELKVEDARAHVSDDAPVIGMDENKNPVRTAEFVQTTAEGKVSVASGQAVLVQGVKVTAKDPKVQTLVIVSARVVPEKGK